MFLLAIADKDPDGKLSWELEFQTDEDTWIPFLNNEVRITADGNIKTRLYRKPQKRNITLHARSHHPSTMKKNTIKNSFSDARKISSGEEEAKHSLKILHNVYRSNGYRHSNLNEELSTSGNSNSLNKPGILCLDYVSEEVSNKIRNFIRKSKLNIRVVFLPGKSCVTYFVLPAHMTTRSE